MFKKFAIGISCIIGLSALALLAGCGEDKNYDELYADKVKIVYELEGGKYLNSTTNVSHYYDYSSNLKIKPLQDEKFSKDGVTRTGGYTLEGWYQEKTVDEDGNAVYSKPWSFATDVVPQSGLTLYAKWKPPINYTYDFVYIDSEGNEQLVLSQKVKAGSPCSYFLDGTNMDLYEYLKSQGANPENTTIIGIYYDEEYTQPCDPDDTERVPQENEETGDTVKLYVEYIEGEFTLVGTKEELIDAAATETNIYLTDDIDLGGASINFTKCNIFEGKGYTVSNFSVSYVVSMGNRVDVDNEGNSDAFCISLFGNVSGVTVKDVTFENMTVTVNVDLSSVNRIYVAPLAVTATDSTFKNVTVTGTFGYNELPEDFNMDKLIFVTDSGVYSKQENPSDGNSYDIELLGKIEN